VYYPPLISLTFLNFSFWALLVFLSQHLPSVRLWLLAVVRYAVESEVM
jgi:hypothetical protein